jgi:hypothetical protein
VYKFSDIFRSQPRLFRLATCCVTKIRYSGFACETMARNAHDAPFYADDDRISENTVISEDAGIAEDADRQCKFCKYFREEPWETGYCQHTHMYVLETFSCDKFLRKISEPDQ